MYLFAPPVFVTRILTTVDVSCPANSTGSNILTGCVCNAGYNGTITGTTSSPFFSGSCRGKYAFYCDALAIPIIA